MKRSLLVVALALPLAAQDTPIDTTRSTITVHVGKAGLLSAAGHDHWISAPVSSGSVRESGALAVQFKVETAKMTVKPDPKVDEKTQATIQKDMETMTLETAKYPEIAFQSSRVEPSGDNQWKLEGNLSIHGVTKPVSLVVKRANGAYTGHTVLKQTDFGIKPITVGGGIVKVKNEIEIEFEVYTK
jgi:polyisoprenoid-binding protein YceI